MTQTQTQTTTASPSANKTFWSGDEDVYKKPDIAMLNSYYMDGDSVDQDVFAEMRSSVLLVSGEHYNRRQSSFYRRIRDSRELSQEQKLRITKNHIRKICQLYANNIMSANPGVGFMPKDETSMHDQKVAELHQSVWQDAINKYYLEDKMDDWCDSYIQIGEVHVKIFWDENAGDIKGYEPQEDPETGNPFINEMGQMVPNEKKPVMQGEFVFEENYGFNTLRPPECKDIRKAEWLCFRKMTNKEELMRRFKDPAVQKYIVAQQDETFVVFDAIRGGYKKSSKQTMIREYYFRPNLLFPNGYYYITTKEGILAEGELPGGLFPIVSRPFDKIQTTPRGRSPIKAMRPYQAEINRSASKIAEHQITLGDDKLMIQNGMKVSAGVSLPGVRTVSYTGSAPTILQGRTGEQYAKYCQDIITELYQVMMVAEDTEQQSLQIDPYVLIYQAARQKKKFQRYIKGFEKFLIEIVKLYIRLAKIHLPDDAVITAVGKNEQINIAEFRQYADTSCEVNIEAQSDDIETKLGKQIVLNHTLQYVGSKLDQEAIGKIMRQMPFGDFDESFEDFTLDYDSARNDMLAMDRGERPAVNQNDSHPYMIKKLSNRTRKADFQFLSPQIQQNYQQRIQIHEQMQSANQMAIQRAEQGFIPTGGYLVSCQFYVTDPSDPTGMKTRQARVPYQALDWLLKQLETQGQGQKQLAGMNDSQLASIANTFNGMQNQAGRPGQQQLTPPSLANGMAAMGQT